MTKSEEHSVILYREMHDNIRGTIEKAVCAAAAAADCIRQGYACLLPFAVTAWRAFVIITKKLSGIKQSTEQCLHVLYKCLTEKFAFRSMAANCITSECNPGYVAKPCQTSFKAILGSEIHSLRYVPVPNCCFFLIARTIAYSLES